MNSMPSGDFFRRFVDCGRQRRRGHCDKRGLLLLAAINPCDLVANALHDVT